VADSTARLEQAIDAIGLDDNSSTRDELYAALLAAKLSLPLAEPPPSEGEWLSDDLDTLEILSTGSEEEPVLPVFTTEERLLKWRPEGGGMASMESRLVFEMAANHGFAAVAVNPGSPSQGRLVPAEIEVLARGRIPQEGGEAMPEGTQVTIGTPATPLSDDVVAVVREAVSAEPSATGALAFLVMQESGPPENAIAVAFAPGVDDTSASDAMGEIVQRAGDVSETARELLFVRAEGDIRQLASEGFGTLVFER
jgi:hypothetical protein